MTETILILHHFFAENHRDPNQLFKRSGLVPKTARNQEFHDNNFSYCSIFLLKIIATRINFKTEVKNFKTEIKNFKTETKNFITSFKLSSFCCKKITTLTLEVIILKLMGKRLMNTKTKKIILNQWLHSKPVRNQEFFVKQCVMIIAISIKLQKSNFFQNQLKSILLWQKYPQLATLFR